MKEEEQTLKLRRITTLWLQAFHSKPRTTMACNGSPESMILHADSCDALVVVISRTAHTQNRSVSFPTVHLMIVCLYLHWTLFVRVRALWIQMYKCVCGLFLGFVHKINPHAATRLLWTSLCWHLPFK